MEATIIGLAGVAGSGKSTAANYLRRYHGFELVKFADGVKSMLRALYVCQDVPSDVIERKIEGDLKEVPCEFLEGKTPRFGMQTIGTEWGRDTISSSIWINSAKRKIQSLTSNGVSVVIDDMRFPNECDLIDSLGGLTVRLEGHRERKESGHQSEALVSSLPVQHVYSNTASIEDMEDWFNDLIGNVPYVQKDDETS